MKILAALARRLIRQDFKDRLHAASDPADVADYIRQEVTPK
jgi:PTS system fructose-specific IIA component